jgi:curved DNA-binding protein CbpA
MSALNPRESIQVPIAHVQARLLDNPFYVLELAPDCSRAEVERAGQKLLAMLELDLSGAAVYVTPFGAGRRDAAKVREAMAELRDPQRRLFHELWVLARPWAERQDALLVEPTPEGGEAGFGGARNTLGWGG